MTLPKLYPILDTASLERHNCPIPHAAEAFLEAGARILQFRHKTHWTREIHAQATLVAKLCQEANATFILNDRADYANLLQSGLHLGQEDLAPQDARKILGETAILGYSTHNPAQMTAAQTEPVDYVAFGPIYPTASKQNPDPQTGIEGLKAVALINGALTTKPLVAIGGITRDNAVFCWNAGADSVAVIADLLPQPCTRQSIAARMAEWNRLSASVYAGNQSSALPIGKGSI